MVSSAFSPGLPWWELAKSLAKVSFIGLVVYSFMKSRLMELFPLVHQDIGQLLSYLRSTSIQLSWRVVFLLLFLGVLDYFYQRYKFNKNLRMTKQEVKDEMRQVEGDPRVKARLKSLMRSSPPPAQLWRQCPRPTW